MRQLLIFLTVCVLSFDISAQEIPKNPNAYDLSGNKTGTWTILYDLDWNVTESIDSAKFYRVISYERGTPSGKVVDYYLNGAKQWEGYMLSDDPEVPVGKCVFYDKYGEIKEIQEWEIKEAENLLNSKVSELERDYMTNFFSKNYSKALELALKCLALKNKIYGKEHSEYIYTLNNVIKIYAYLEDYSECLESELEYLVLAEKIHGKENIEYIKALNFLARLYMKFEDYSRSLEIWLECLELTEKVFTKEHPEYVNALLYMSRTYFYLKNSPKSLKSELECLVLAEKIYGKENIEYFKVLTIFANWYHESQNYANSLVFWKETLVVAEKIHGKESLQYANILSTISVCYAYLGKTDKIIELNLESLEIIEKTYGKEHPSYLNSLSNLATSYSQLEDYSKSLEINLESLVIAEKIYGKENIVYHDFLYILAYTYMNLEDYSRSLEISLECVDLYERVYSKEHPKYIQSLSLTGKVYHQLGNYDKSLEINLECLALINKTYVKGHRSYNIYLNTIIADYLALGDYLNAYRLTSENQKNTIKLIKENEKTLDTDLIQDKYSYLIQSFQFMFDITNYIAKPEEIKNQFNILSFFKSRELSKNSALISGLYKSGDKDLISLYEHWILVNKRIASAYERTLEESEALLTEIDKLKDEADNLERQLISRSSFFASMNSDYFFNDIVSRLNRNEIYVDIINVPSYDFDLHASLLYNKSYYAYVIQKNDTVPQLVYLGSASDFDNYHNYFSSYTKERPSNKEFSNGNIVLGNICYENFWSKLEPYLENISTVYFSPDGVYSKINPNVLYDSKSSSFLIDKYDIVYVSNVEDFVHQKENIKLYERSDNLNAVLVGNPTFLLEKDEVVLASNEIQSRSINQDELNSLQRGMLLSDLPGTQTEVDLISDNLKSKSWDVEVITGIDATETRVKSIEAPKILHIATHGFFFEDLEMVKRSNMISTDNKKAIANPMTRSGLIFSGAENTMNGEILAGDNGWLNSSEVSLLNLRGTELVVLSACETGIGDVQNGKGVYGLQRAIRLAGAESLIMSMWEVDDKATQELMTYFYDYWIDKKMTKKDAFNKAQGEIREIYKHPYYWGAFIMLGE